MTGSASERLSQGNTPWRMSRAIERQAAAEGRGIQGEGTIFVGYEFAELMDPERIRSATLSAVLRTEALSSIYTLRRGVVHRERPARPVLDVLVRRVNERQEMLATARKLAGEAAAFDLSSELLVRVIVVHGGNSTVVAWLLDHTVCDGAGAAEFLDRVSREFDRTGSVADDTGVLDDYANKEAAFYASAKGQQAAEAYMARLDHSVPLLRLVNGPEGDGVVTDSRAVRADTKINGDEAAIISDEAKEARVSKFVSTLGHIADRLRSVSAQPQTFSFITPMQGRLTGHSKTVGNFVNLLPISMPEFNWESRLDRRGLQAALAQAFNVQSIQFSKLANDYLPEDQRQLVASRRVFVSGMNRRDFSLAGVQGQVVNSPISTALFDLSIWLDFTPTSIELQYLGRRALFRSGLDIPTLGETAGYSGPT